VVVLVPYCLVLVWASIACSAWAQSEQPAPSALDEAFTALQSLEPGQDLARFQPLEVAMVAARANPSLRADLEARLVGILQAESTELAKDYACRQLTTVGSETAVPALAALLPQARASYMARYALEGIGGPAATRALRESLPLTTGLTRVGLVTTLGSLADSDAVPLLAPLLDDPDPLTCEATLVALGRIGTVAAAAEMREFAVQRPGELSTVLVDALLTAGETLCRQGELGAAADVFTSLSASESEHVRAAAFRGLLTAVPAERRGRLITALADDASWQRAVAADCVMQLTQPDDIAAVAEAIDALPADGQLAALLSLQSRSDPAVRAAALRALDGAEPTVQIAALRTLIVSAQAEDVPHLVHVTATAAEATVRAAASDTLRLMTAAGTNEALMTQLHASLPHQPTVVRCAAARRSPDFVPALLTAAASGDAETRREAFQALEFLASPREAAALVALLAKTPAGDVRDAADRAAWMACQRIADPDLRTAPLLDALRQSAGDERCALLPTLARLGGPPALAAVHEAMQSAEPAVRDAGYRALANWPDDTVADQLLQIARSSDVSTYRVWALRAYARVVSLPSERPVESTFTMLTGALDLAERTEDKELIISRLAAVRVPEALALLVSFIDQPELRGAAVPAVFLSAKGLSQSHPEPARAALEKLQSLTDDSEIRQQIPRVIRDIDARQQNPPR
jgi:HEAT repeat protein